MTIEKETLFTLFKTVKAVVWDMDGLLIDSEPYHFIAHQQALAENGVKIDRDFYIKYGVASDPRKFYAKAFTEAGKPFDDALFVRVRYRKVAIFQNLQHDNGMKVVEPAVIAVETMYRKGLQLTIATGVNSAEVVRTLRSAGLLVYFPTIIVESDFGLAKKPEPDLYKKAASILGKPVSEIAAIEDSTNGAQAAVTAGVHCLVVPNEFTVAHTFPKRAIQTTFSDITAALG